MVKTVNDVNHFSYNFVMVMKICFYIADSTADIVMYCVIVITTAHCTALHYIALILSVPGDEFALHGEGIYCKEDHELVERLVS